MQTPLTHLLYLHGFRSSPQSLKARKMAALMAEKYSYIVWCCPQLPPSPELAAQQIMALTANWPGQSMAVMGSSLGGFYATFLAEQRACKAVLLNPAIKPARDLAKYIGEQSVWQRPDEKFFFEPQFVDQLTALDAGPLTRPEDYLAIIAKGDEVLDWREMAERYEGAQQLLLEGSDHALSDFDAQLPAVLDFLGLAA
jgi:hypothetical protein